MLIEINELDISPISKRDNETQLLTTRLLSINIAAPEYMKHLLFKFKYRQITTLATLMIGGMAHADYSGNSCRNVFTTPGSPSQVVVNNVNRNADSSTLKVAYSKYFTLGSDPQKILKLVGTSNYSSKPVSLFFRELIQNSVDANRRQKNMLSAKDTGLSAMFSGLKKALNDNYQTKSEIAAAYRGKVNVFVDSQKNWVVVEDNGSGMNLDTIEKAFLTLGGTEKGELASGGFGIAKGALFYGSKKIFVSTIQNGLIHEFTIDSQQLLSDPNAKIKVTTNKAPGQPNGTIVAIELPDNSQPLPTSADHIDLHERPYLVDEVDVSFANTYLGKSLEDIRTTLQGFKTSQSQPGFMKPFFKKIDLSGPDILKDTMHFGTWGDAEIIISKTKLKTGAMQHHVLSNGIYQFSKPIQDSQYNTLPYRIFINLKPKVKANDPNYPFDLTRDGIRPSIENDYNQVIERVQNHVARIMSEETEQLIKNLIPLQKVSLQSRVERLKSSREHPREFFDDELEIDNGKDMLSTNDEPMDSTSDLPILNNRTTMNFTGVEHDSVILFSKLSAVSEHIKSRLIELGSTSEKTYLGALGNKLRNFKTGVIIKKGIHGINFSGKFNGIFFNPLTLEKGADGYEISENIYATIVHEITHVLREYHNEPFIITQNDISNVLAAEGYNAIIKSVILEILQEHRATFIELRKRYRDQSVINLDPE